MEQSYKASLSLLSPATSQSYTKHIKELQKKMGTVRTFLQDDVDEYLSWLHANDMKKTEDKRDS